MEVYWCIERIWEAFNMFFCLFSRTKLVGVGFTSWVMEFNRNGMALEWMHYHSPHVRVKGTRLVFSCNVTNDLKKHFIFYHHILYHRWGYALCRASIEKCSRIEHYDFLDNMYKSMVEICVNNVIHYVFDMGCIWMKF